MKPRRDLRERFGHRALAQSIVAWLALPLLPSRLHVASLPSMPRPRPAPWPKWFSPHRHGAGWGMRTNLLSGMKRNPPNQWRDSITSMEFGIWKRPVGDPEATDACVPSGSAAPTAAGHLPLLAHHPPVCLVPYMCI